MTIDEAIKDIKDNIKPVVGGKSLDMAIDALERPRWIPVEERLPEPWNLVLVTDSCKNVSVCQMALNQSDGWYDECENWMYFFDSVIAWMPLPEPWKGEEDEAD